MPTLPDFTALGERPTPQSAGGVAQFEPGNPRYVGLAGQELSTAGREMEDASSIVAATNERQDDIVAQDAANKLKMAAIQAEFDPKSGFKSVKEGNAVGNQFLDSYTQRLGDSASQLRTGLGNDNQRRMFDKYAQQQHMQFQSALLAHQAQETDKFNDSTWNNTIDLSLRSMGQNPLNEMTFQTERARIEGTIDQVGKAKGLPPQAVTELKGKMLDAAYTTRITSILQGVPGSVQANPYLAEKMFEQVQDQLGPQAQIHLASQVQKSVQSVQARDTAQRFIYGSGAVQPKEIAPAATGSPLQAIVMDQESGGQRYGAGGRLLTSIKGAQGEMQVMPGTAANPGYGVLPAQNNSPEELARVGRDYLGAMSARYDEPAMVLAAYNAGPANVDKWLAKFGDPRTGAIDAQTWAEKLPFAETRAYVMNGLKKLASTGTQPSAPINAPTVPQLKGDLFARIAAARKVADQQYPGDTAYADAVASRVEGYGRTVLANAQAQESAARDTLLTGVIGKQQDGSDKPTSLDALLADPQMKAAWEQSTPETKLALQERYAKGDKGFTPESFATYYQLKGQAANDADAFSQVDLGQYFGKIPDTAVHELVQDQARISKKDAAAAAKDVNWSRARSAVSDMLRPLGLGPAAPKGNVEKAKQTEVFYGKLNESLQQYHDQNGKWPDTNTTRQFAAGLLAEGKQAGSVLPPGWFDSSTRYFQSEDPSKFYAPLPTAPRQLNVLRDSFARVMGRAPTQSELQDAYTKYKLQGGK